MGRCVVVNCRNAYSKTRITDKNITYHAFPKNDILRLKWIKEIKRPEDWFPDYNSRVCSEHFELFDYERDLKAELLNIPPKKILKPDAVPHLNSGQPHDIDPILMETITDSLHGNKENITNNLIHPNNDYVISYLDSKVFEGSCSSLTNTSNQTRIIPLHQLSRIPSEINALYTTPGLTNNICTTNNTVFKLDELCRLCGSYSNRMTPIFDNIKHNYLEIIENHFPEIEIHRDDILPLQICFNCEGILSSWYQFYKTCNIVNRRFQSILKKLVNNFKIQKKKIFEEIINPVNMSLQTIPQDEKLNEHDFLHNTVTANDISDIKEIEIVVVSPEGNGNKYPWFTGVNHYDATGNSCNNLEFVDFIDACEPDYVECKHDESKASEIFLKEEDIDLSDYESVATPSDSSWEVHETGELPKYRLEAQLASSIRHRHRRRYNSLNMRRMCHVCGKIFKYPESLRRHLKTVHSDEKPFKCHLCPSSFNRNHNLTTHIRGVHQRQRVYVKKHVPRLCDYCGKILLSVRSLEEHISSLHTKKALYECDKCHLTFYRKLIYDKHRAAVSCDKIHSKCNQFKVEVFLKYCEICGLEFKKEHFYIKHKVKHMTSFTCSVCSVSFDDAVVLNDHVESEHPEMKPFDCGVCGKKFKSKPLLNCHAVIHTGEKRYQCQYCSLKFLKKKYLTTHVLTHTGERPFVCTICGKGFKQSGDMRKHKANHIRKQL